MTKHLYILYEGQRLADEEFELRNGKANPFGWSTYEIWHLRPESFPGADPSAKLGELYCGEPINLLPGYSFEIVEEAN